MIRLIIIVFTFILLLGSAVGGFYLWGLDPVAKLASFVGFDENPIQEAPKQKPARGTYVDYGLLIVPVVNGQEIRTQVELIIRLEVTPSDQSKVASQLPRLQNAFLQEMMTVLPVQMRGGRTIDQAFVSRRLLSVGNNVLMNEKIINVIIEKVNVR